MEVVVCVLDSRKTHAMGLSRSDLKPSIIISSRNRDLPALLINSMSFLLVVSILNHLWLLNIALEKRIDVYVDKK